MYSFSSPYGFGYQKCLHAPLGRWWALRPQGRFWARCFEAAVLWLLTGWSVRWLAWLSWIGRAERGRGIVRRCVWLGRLVSLRRSAGVGQMCSVGAHLAFLPQLPQLTRVSLTLRIALFDGLSSLPVRLFGLLASLPFPWSGLLSMTGPLARPCEVYNLWLGTTR